MDKDESCILSLDHSNIDDPMIITVESLDSSKKRKLRAEESDLLPLTKHFCLEKQASLPDSSCPSSDIEYTECSYAMDDTKTSDETSSSPSVTGPSLSMFKDSSYATGSSGYATSSNIDQCCSKDSEEATPKPNIDQEFEKYFSSLMM
ncbi:Protein FAR-RED-ELONGATED HYPOCOTYL 1-LIKE [Cardamine amara subsp. amara]|uniref:Protein FAR-RED-ELONGATED HYPOCOTYL 1-LIKE n=1 Tax=Cardamine amara subsp. amara TaxID=228776 RepID=A0ABD1A9I3_CARAN